LRAIDPERFAIVDESLGGALLEEIEESKAFFEVYDGAVYMFQASSGSCPAAAGQLSGMAGHRLAPGGLPWPSAAAQAADVPLACTCLPPPSQVAPCLA
jgi:hypothetical protein